MRISDWSSDVCSSDLPGLLYRVGQEPEGSAADDRHDDKARLRQRGLQGLLGPTDHRPQQRHGEAGRHRSRQDRHAEDEGLARWPAPARRNKKRSTPKPHPPTADFNKTEAATERTVRRGRVERDWKKK